MDPVRTDDSRPFDVALVNGRVIDPESGFDAVTSVGIRGDRIAVVGDAPAPARLLLDCAGLVVSPGFIDLHSHAQTLMGSWLQALDGVTTAVDLEAGALALPHRLSLMSDEGRATNFGYSAGWAAARAQVLAGVDHAHEVAAPSFSAFQAAGSVPGWTRPATDAEVRAILNLLEQALDDGALGVGALLGYLPDTEPEEFFRVASLAATHAMGTFVHSRSALPSGEVTALDAVREVIAVAERTGGHLHLCHLNSTSGHAVEPITALISEAADHQLRVSTEVYPYARGCTVIGAAFLSPAELRREGRAPHTLIYAATGESIRDEARLNQLRAADPGGLVLTLSYDTSIPRERADLDLALTFTGAAFASDALPAQSRGVDVFEESWPPTTEVFTHPRSAGCFARVLGSLVRERGLLTLAEALRRCTIVPAQILTHTAPSMARKGRLQVGMDADIAVFNPATVTDRATYTRLAPSTGFSHVLVNGTPVVRDGQLLPDTRPGRPVLGRTLAGPEAAA